MNSISTLVNYPQKVAGSSFSLFKKSDLPSTLTTIADFIIQVNSSWTFYLAYTSIRCAQLTYEYYHTPERERYRVWEKAQVYASTKTLGLVVGQVALLALGFTTPAAATLILAWGAVLFSLSAYAHYRATQSGVVDRNTSSLESTAQVH